MPMPQGTTLRAKAAFTFKVPGARGRPVTVKPGDCFWVTNCETDQNKRGVVMVDREGRGYISQGYAFDPAQIKDFFHAD